jgi:predicted 3-demethylubiquinone-9 3-methyltransferase (glyoxalase superfamily)
LIPVGNAVNHSILLSRECSKVISVIKRLPRNRLTKSKTNVEESIIGLCNILAKQGKDREAISEWMEDKFGVSLWSIADMRPETLKEILDKKQK